MKGFPFMLVLQIKQVAMFCGQFKKYRFANWQIIKLVTQSGGIMGCKVSNFVGLFDNLKHLGIKGSHAVRMMAALPEFALQNRKDLFRHKVELIQKESGRGDIYIRNFVKRHPDIAMK